jgi:hypothetical protein
LSNSGIILRNPVAADLDRVGVVEAKTRGYPGSELRLRPDHLAKRRMQGLILVGAEEPESLLELASRRLGINEEAHAIPRPETLKVPDPLILDLAASLGAE